MVQTLVPPSYENGGFQEVVLLPDVIKPTRELALATTERKVVYDLTMADTPQPINDLAARLQRVRPQLPLFDTAIMKRYRLDDSELSGAYTPHVGPPHYIGALAVVSLDSLATFYAKPAGDRLYEMRCYPGTALLVHPELLHWVTPPMQGAERHIVFFGSTAAANA